MSLVAEIRGGLVARLMREARFLDNGGEPFTAAVYREVADEIERRHAGADRVLCAVWVWGAMAWAYEQGKDLLYEYA